MISPIADMPEIDILRGQLQRAEHEVDLLHEQLRLLRSQLYGRKSERLSAFCKSLDDKQF